VLLVGVVCLPTAAYGQNEGQEGYTRFILNRIASIKAAKTQEAEANKDAALEDIKSRITIRNSTKNSETPSISSNTTSLVDRSSASDLTGIALNFAGLRTDSDEMAATSMSATVSAYAFKAAAEGRQPLDPAFYNANRDWRRVSFTFGFDYPEDKAGDINERATIVGIKYLPYDKRDASDSGNQTIIREISAGLEVVGKTISTISEEIKTLVINALVKQGKEIPAGATAVNRTYFSDASWPSTYASLSEADRAEIDNAIKNRIEVFVQFSKDAIGKADEIRRKPQIAFAFLTKQRREDRPDEHAVEAIFDLGLAPRFNLALNASFNYVDNKVMEDSRGGRVAADLQLQLNRDNLEGRMPVFLSFSGDGSWMTDVTPVYRAQAKLTIPLWGGIEVPISVSYASRTEFIKEADIRGKFGFTFDVARIAKAFGGGILGVK
jgi:hypothetical protein